MGSNPHRGGLLLIAVATAIACGISEPGPTAGFWFDGVTFEIAEPELARFGGPLSEADKRRIVSIAWSELKQAYASMAITFTDDPNSFYRVRVMQDFGASGAAGHSQVFVGGQGAVNFTTIVKGAVAYAPLNAERATLIDGIGRGIGRSAAHEFAHQIVPGVNLHSSTDPGSYEFESADRTAQYYGDIHWGLARDPLLKRLGAPRD